MDNSPFCSMAEHRHVGGAKCPHDMILGWTRGSEIETWVMTLWIVEDVCQ